MTTENVTHAGRRLLLGIAAVGTVLAIAVVAVLLWDPARSARGLSLSVLLVRALFHAAGFGAAWLLLADPGARVRRYGLGLLVGVGALALPGLYGLAAEVLTGRLTGPLPLHAVLTAALDALAVPAFVIAAVALARDPAIRWAPRSRRVGGALVALATLLIVTGDQLPRFLPPELHDALARLSGVGLLVQGDTVLGGGAALLLVVWLLVGVLAAGLSPAGVGVALAAAMLTRALPQLFTDVARALTLPTSAEVLPTLGLLLEVVGVPLLVLGTLLSARSRAPAPRRRRRKVQAASTARERAARKEALAAARAREAARAVRIEAREARARARVHGQTTWSLPPATTRDD